jgi:hypothetical protein
LLKAEIVPQKSKQARAKTEWQGKEKTEVPEPPNAAALVQAAGNSG